MKNVTVVGADGFIGGALVKGLRQGGYDPISITRNSKIEIYDTDIVFYAAGSSTPYNASDLKSDLNDLVEFLNRLRDLKKQPLFVFSSSAGTIYDKTQPQPYKETSSLAPVNSYGSMKLDQEAAIRQVGWVRPLILRLSNIYGPYQKPKPGFGVIAHWAQKVCRCEPIEMMGNSGRDYLYIVDLVNIVQKIMTTPRSYYEGLTVNVGSGDTVYLSDLYEVFVKVAGRPIEIIKNPARTLDVNSVSLDVSLAKKLFDWKPKISLEEGVKGVLDAAAETAS